MLSSSRYESSWNKSRMRKNHRQEYVCSCAGIAMFTQLTSARLLRIRS